MIIKKKKKKTPKVPSQRKVKEKARVSTEKIFAHAVALDQSGRLRNTIYALGKQVYIKNSDNTVLLDFTSSDSDFHNPVSFRANDYEGEYFYEEDGKIIFETLSDGGLLKKKACAVPEDNFEDIDNLCHKMTRKYLKAVQTCKKRKKPINSFSLGREILSLLDRSLSHIEISIVKGKVVLAQRNIYSGSVSYIEKAKKGFGISGDNLSGDFGPIGVRTPDFEALFTFQDSVSFTLPPDLEFIKITGTKFKMNGFIGTCLYDEMGTINYVE